MRFLAVALSSLAYLAANVAGHSWLECADYRGTITTPAAYSEAQCLAVGRDWNNVFGSATNQFGADRGYNYQPGSGRTCRDARNTDAQDYPGGFKAQYRPGSTYRLVWPAKNHARVRDFGTRIYAACGADRAALEASVSALSASNRFLIKNFGVNTNGGSVGFGNCGSLANGDRAVCFGDLTVPATLNGECTFVWYWPFNGDNDIYTTCWDATVSPTATAGSPAPVVTQAPTTKAPAGAAGACATPQPQWQQCGGQGFDTAKSCCQAGLTCRVLNDHYSQCLSNAAASEGRDEVSSASSGAKYVVIGAASAVGAVALVVAGVMVAKSRKTEALTATEVPLNAL